MPPSPSRRPRPAFALCLGRFARAALAFALAAAVGCLTPPLGSKPAETGGAAMPSTATPPPLEKMTDIDAWTAAAQMSPGVNIGNTLENTTTWETGWGQPLITKEFVDSLARLGFKAVRLPVA